MVKDKKFMLFGEWIRQRRLELGWTVLDVGRKAGTAPPYEIERRCGAPRSWERARKLIRMLGLPEDEGYRIWYRTRQLRGSRKVKAREPSVGPKTFELLVRRVRRLLEAGVSVRQFPKSFKRLICRTVPGRRYTDRVALLAFGVRSVEELKCPRCGFAPKPETLYGWYILGGRGPRRAWRWTCAKCTRFAVLPNDVCVDVYERVIPRRKPVRRLARLLRSYGMTLITSDEKYEWLVVQCSGKRLVIRVVWFDSIPSVFQLEQAGKADLYLFCDEILDSAKAQIVASMLAARLGGSVCKIPARRTDVINLGASECRKFLLDNHLMGWAAASVHLGLVTREAGLVAVATFARGRRALRQSAQTWELVRFGSKRGCRVVGALGKLVKYFCRHYHPEYLISFVDLRFGTGEAYKRAGFELVGKTSPNYFWVKGLRRIHRYALRKDRLASILGASFDPGLSEAENLLRVGYKQVFDLGHLKFRYCEVDS